MGEGRIEIQFDGLTVTAEGFGTKGHLARSMSMRLHSLEVRDCAAAQPGSTTSGSGVDSGKVLSCR